MDNIWQYLNNKKTNFGAGLLLAAMIVQKLSEIWAGPSIPVWIPQMVETLEWLGSLITGVGLGHKGVKRIQNRKVESDR